MDMGEATITFSVSDIVWICGAICTMSAALAVICSVLKKAKEPENIQNTRLDALEAQVKKFAEYLDRDNKRLNAVDEGNRITQRALLALLSHAINGNDIDELIKAKKSLEDYLIDKGGMES
jgi:hypothetical protein